MRAVAERLASFIGGLTTVPDTTARGPLAEKPPAKAKTTFGDSAAEIVEGTAPPRSRASMALLVVALLGLGAGGVAFSRWRAHSAQGAPASAPASAAESPPPSPAAAQLAVVAPPPSPAGKTPAAAPTPSPVAAPPPVGASKKEEAGSGKKKGRHHGVAVASAAAPPAAEAPAAVPSESSASKPAPSDFSGAWEGPWTDNERHQSGRLYLQVTSSGGASGWLSNATAGRSYRLTGRAEAPGEFALACQCPVNQGFNVRVVLHQGEASDLKGRLSLSAAAGVFGQSHVVLRRTAAR